MSVRKILIVDDEENMRHSISLILEREGYEVFVAENGKQALGKLSEDDFDFIISDLKMPEMDGIEFLEKAKELYSTPIIMMSAYGTIDTAVQAMSLGAYDYISKPFKVNEILLTLKKIEERERLKTENNLLKKEINKEHDFADIIAKSKCMLEVFDTIKKVANFKTTVLLNGESGTGKELIARAIHNSGNRENCPFIAVNCGAIPESLLESEFFGYVKGAFTDAKFNKKGLFEEADCGTLFLDEIGELQEQLQVKLLRVLQEEEIKRVGGNKNIKIDVRIIAASAKDLGMAVSEGSFREDLFYRLNVMPIKLPPLRDRKEDISILSDHFINKYNKRLSKSVKGISAGTLQKMMNYGWKGNVRELENVIERAMLLTNSDILEEENFSLDNLASHNIVKGDRSNLFDIIDEGENLSMKNVLKKVEKKVISNALKKTDNNKVQTAKTLGISYRALMYKLKEYEIV